MRSTLAGIFLLLAASAVSFGQATGFVKGLGFQGNFRPDCWTPLLVHLDSTSDKADDYQVQVRQQDMDRDLVVYTHTVTLGPGARQDYWVYFIPEPVGVAGGSLPPGPADLARVLKVYLYDKTGSKQIANLPVSFPANNVDPKFGGGPMMRGRGTRMVLAVVERSRPAWIEYGGALGLIEDVYFVPVSTRDLPDSVLGYDAVDAVLWMDSSAQDLTPGGGVALEALKQFVRKGGNLAVCQPRDQFDRLAPLADLLPVVAREGNGDWAIRTEAHARLDPLIELARGGRTWPGDVWGAVQAKMPQWDYARAKPRPDAVVDKWIEWTPAVEGGAPADRSPYLARRGYELGSVSWVAQDLGNPALHSAPAPPSPGVKLGETTIASTGWPRVWDRVFGWANETRSSEEQKHDTQYQKERFDESAGPIVDVGKTLLHGVEHGGRGVALITLAIFFFIGYWVIAGPGSYLLLAAKGHKGWSWLAFAATALLATVLTVGVVKLVLRGSPEIRHFSVVRLAPTDPAPDGSPRFVASMRSRIGLYVPRDGDQRVTLNDTAAGRTNMVTPLAVHPQFVDAKAAGFPNQARYVVNTDQFTAGKNVSADFPFRSTLKKMEADWSGTVAEGITGRAEVRPPLLLTKPDAKDPKLTRKVPRSELTGKLTNKTGRDLRNVYLAVQSLAERGDPLSVPGQVTFLPVWRKDQEIDLEAEFDGAANLDRAEGDVPNASASSRKSLKGSLKDWSAYWFSAASSGVADYELDDSDREFLASVPLLSFYDRIGPDFNSKLDSRERKEVLRRGGRDMNLSPALAAGKLAIVAQAPDGPLPVPLEVEGDKIHSEGTTIYQVVLPLDRSSLLAPPATQPATRPAG